MSGSSLIRRLLTAALIAAVAVQGLALILPHSHGPHTGHFFICDNPDCPNPTGGHFNSERHAEHHHACLACSITSIHFFGSVWTAAMTAEVSQTVAPAESSSLINPAHPKHGGVRGPPLVV